MGFEKVIIPSEKDIIIQQLEKKIVSGELAPNTKLPSERELAEQLGVTKSVVHFALKELEQLKFLRSIPRQGTYINNWLSCGNFDTLNAVLHLQNINVEPQLEDSLICLRNTIESDAMLMCSEKCTEADYEELENIIDKLEESSPSDGSEVHARLIMQFHTLIIEKSRNLIYPIIMNAFMDFAIDIWVRCVEYWTKEKIVEYEREQLRLIREGNGKSAGKMITDMYDEYLQNHNHQF